MICPLCNAIYFAKWGHVGDYVIMLCQGCGVGLTTPFPDHPGMIDTNCNTYNVDRRVAVYMSLRKRLENRYRRQLRRIACSKPYGKLLDVGCSIGLFANQANLAGFHAEGVELNRACAEYAVRTFGLTIHSDIPEPVTSDEGYDVVTLYDVLEHVPDPVSFLTRIRHILKPDGLLVIQTPNLDSLMAEVLRSKWAWLSPPDHLFHFTPATLTQVINKAGFTVNNKQSWEPASDFAGNLLEAFIPDGFAGRLLRWFLRISRVVELPIFLLHGIWWRKLRGALIVIEASPK